MEERYNKIKERYSKNKNSTIIKNFYSKEINKGKSYKAVSFDNISFIVLVFITLTTFLAIKSNTIILPVFISLITIFFITIGITKHNVRKRNERIKEVNEELKSKRVLRELTQHNREEFINFSKEILEKYYQSEFVRSDDGLDLIGTVKNKVYGVKCIKTSMDDKIQSKRINDFNDYISYKELDEGIIITNSYFTEGIKDETSLILLDFNGIKEILKSVEMFPTNEEITNYIIHRYDDRKKDIRNQFRIVNTGKIIKLYAVFFIFYTISYFVSYSIYYRIMGVVAFIIATILGGFKITEYVRLKGKFSLHK